MVLSPNSDAHDLCKIVFSLGYLNQEMSQIKVKGFECEIHDKRVFGKVTVKVKNRTNSDLGKQL